MLLFFVFLCQLAGAIGAVFTMPRISTWYAVLVKPPFNPPSWIFGPVWTMLYTLMGVAAFLVWQRRKKQKKAVQHALTVFGAQLALNSLWSIVFFGLGQLWGAFLVIIALWSAIFATYLLFWKLSKTSGVLFLPYLAWVTFASLLNFSVALLN